MAAGSSGLPMDLSSFSYFSNILSEINNINILGLYKAFWYTGSAFTRYFNHNHHNHNNIYRLPTTNIDLTYSEGRLESGGLV